MPKQKRPTEKSSKTGFAVGRAGFAKISAVEGIRLKPAMEKRAAEASSKGLSAEEFRKVIVRTYRKAYCILHDKATEAGDNPFAAFSEWTSEIDEESYSGL
jgi:hypothetical protein